jgi:hypothetical protein
MPKDTMAAQPCAHRRHNPLHEELLETSHGPGQLRKVARNKRKEKQERAEEYVDSGLSKRILQLAKEQQDEIAEERAAATAIGADAFLGRTGAAPTRFQVRQEEEESDEGEFEDDGFEDYDVDEEIHVDGDDEELFNRFVPQDGHQEQRISLADKILEKIAEHEAKLAGAGGAGSTQDDAPALPPKVVDVYTKYALLVAMQCVGVGFMADGSHAESESCSRDINPESRRRRSRSPLRCGIGRRYCSSPDRTSGRRMRATRRQSCLLRKSRRRLRSKSVFSVLGHCTDR